MSETPIYDELMRKYQNQIDPPSEIAFSWDGPKLSAKKPSPKSMPKKNRKKAKK